MKGIRELKGRLKGVTNIKKITRAMELVAATKLRRLQERALATRPYADRIGGMMRRVASKIDASASPLLARPDKVSREAVIVIGADRGLCGSYNSNLHREVRAHLAELDAAGVEPVAHAIGRRAQQYLRKNPSLAQGHFWQVPMEKLVYADVKKIMGEIVQDFVSGKVQRVTVISTRMKTLSTFVPRVQALLPIAKVEGDARADAGPEVLLEPNPQAIMDALLPRYLEMQLYAAVLEALASEFAARRIAMKSATDNATDMIANLRMQYNKARQEGITAELLDIAGAMVGAKS